MMLTDNQVDIIRRAVDASGITLKTLKADLIDHICCDVEFRLAEGIRFDDALRLSLQELAPAGLRYIEQRTLQHLNPKLYFMKKVIYVIGLLTTVSMTMGIMFKLMYLPGGDEFFNAGFLAFALFFVPVITIRRFRENREWSVLEKLRSAFAVLSTVGTALSVFLKLYMPSQLSGLLLMISVCIFCFGFLPLQFYFLYKDSQQSGKEGIESELL